jgi:hypothetical protein
MFARLVVEKDDGATKRRAILWGVDHTGSKEQYAPIQAEMNDVARNGYVMFRERVKSFPKIPIKTPNGRVLKRVLGKELRMMYRKVADAKGGKYQGDFLVYPPGCLVVDLSLEEVVNFFDEQGVTFNLAIYRLILLLRVGKKAPWWFRVLSWPNAVKVRIEKIVSHLLVSFYKRRIHTADAHREVVIFERIQILSGKKNLFLIYGSAHIPGFLQSFLADGWIVTEVSPNIATYVASRS